MSARYFFREEDRHAPLAGVRQYWRAVGVTPFVNWTVEPFLVALIELPRW